MTPLEIAGAAMIAEALRDLSWIGMGIICELLALIFAILSLRK